MNKTLGWLHVLQHTLGGALVWWLWEETHVSKVVSSNPDTIYWMDIFYIHICCKICKVFEKTKINEKEAGVAHFCKKNCCSTHKSIDKSNLFCYKTTRGIVSPFCGSKMNSINPVLRLKPNTPCGEKIRKLFLR